MREQPPTLEDSQVTQLESETTELSIHPTEILYSEGTKHEHTMEGWIGTTKDLEIKALRKKGTNKSFGITFHAKGDADHNAYEKLTGKGMFNAARQIRPFIEFLEKETSGNWHASCDEPKRMAIYRRWLPENKIVYE